VQYADYAAWQREWLRGEALERQLAYWRQQLGGGTAALRLAADRPRGAARGEAGGRRSAVLPEGLAAALRALSRRHGATLFMTLLATFDLLLRRHTGQEDILVGTPVAGRGRAETEGLIGFFVNTLVLRTDLSGEPTFTELLGRVRESALGAYTHQDVPFEKLVEELRPERKVGSNPFFDVMINYAAASTTAANSHGGHSGLTVEQMELTEPDRPVPLMLVIGDSGSEIVVHMKYQEALFTPARIASMLEQFTHLLAQVAESPDAPIASYSLRVAEGDALLPDPTVALPAPAQTPVAEMVFERASESPDSVAISRGGRTWSYVELADSARALARVLIADGLRPGEVVAVTGPRSFGLIASMLAAFASRGVLLTLDPALPEERRRVMLRETGARYLLHVGEPQPEDAWMLEESSRLVKIVDPNSGSSSDTEAMAADATELPEAEDDDPAYVFFTSGTTGVPKAILGCHKSLSHFICWLHETFAVEPQDRAGLLAGLSFDAVLRDIFTPLAGGATLCLPEEENAGPEQMLTWLERERVTLLHTVVPSLAQFWLANRPEGVTLRYLRCAFFVGEPLTDTLVRRWREAFPHSGEIINLYGATETTLAKFYGRVPAEPAPGPQPVTHALPQTQGLVLREGDRLCGVGEVGEIVIRTPFRSLGYLNADGVVGGRFFQNPFRDDPDDLLYRTGDRGRYRPDGALEILGRIDHQVKIRGVRIEPGEVESMLRQYPGVRDAVVLAREDAEGAQRLVGYVVVGDGGPPDVAELRRHLQRSLPDAMVPNAFVLLDSLPLTPNGKLDRRALPEPEREDSEREGRYVAPRTPAEEVLAGIWADVLGVERVSVHDNFFELGGHSLLVTKAVFRVRTAFDVELPVRAVFDRPTVAEMAQLIESLRQEEHGGRRLPPIEPAPRDGEVPTSSGQELVLVLAEMEGRPSFYGRMLRLKGTLDVDALGRALGEVVRRHEALRTTFETRGGRSVQVINAARPLPLTPVDLSGLPQAEQDAAVQALADELMQTPFDLARGPLFRTALVRVGEDEHVLLYVILHIICDLWSLDILNSEVALLFEAFSQSRESPLPELPVQYGDFAYWERRWLSDGALDSELSFWRRQLEGAPITLPLPTDRPRPPRQTFRGEHLRLRLPDELHESLTALCRRDSVTLYMAALAAFNVLLRRYTGRDDILVGTGVAGRSRGEVAGLIGQFVNALVLRTRLDGDPTFRELLARVRETTLKSFAHQEMPFWELVKEFAPDRDLAYGPLVQVGLVAHHTGERAAEAAPIGGEGGLESSIYTLGTNRTPFELLLTLEETPEGFFVIVTYNADLFDPSTAERVFDDFSALLGAVAENPGRRISELRTAEEDERKELAV
jgi:amino acid adenylation domain-containing protein